MTIGGWVVFIVVAIIVLACCACVGCFIGDETGAVWGLLFGVVICVFIFAGFNWYYSSTASGSRAMKSQDSNFNMGIKRKVTVYDMEGDIIKEYEGTFDIEYDDDRILFDDEKGQRHIIYYPTGTVIVDEVD